MADKIVIAGRRIIHLDGSTDSIVIINTLIVQDEGPVEPTVATQPNSGIILEPRVTITLEGQS